MYAIVEKANHLHIHGLCDTLASAQRHLTEVIPVYVARGFYMDKTLTGDSFEIIEHNPKSARRARK